MYCENCGHKIETGDLYCPNCGSKQNIESKHKIKDVLYSNKYIKIISYCLVFAMGVLCCVLYIRYKENKLLEQYISYNINENNITTDKEKTSKHQYENSTYRIGIDMPPGEYVLFTPTGNGYFEITSDSSGDSIIVNESFDYNSIITVQEGEYFKLTRCYAEPIETADEVLTSDEGMFKIGTHLDAGEYKLEATGSSGYYCVYNDGRQDDIATNDNFSGVAYVTVQDGQYLLLTRCKIVE